MDFCERLFLRGEIKVTNIRRYVLPKLEEEIIRLTIYADSVEKAVKEARQGKEEALADLIKLAFSEREGR